MRKVFKIGLAVGGGLFVVILLVGYFYGRELLKKIPALASENLKQQGIDFTYRSVDVPPVGLTLKLNGVSVLGPKLPYFLKSESAALSIGLSGNWPPLKISFKADKPQIEENLKAKPIPSSSSAPASPAAPAANGEGPGYLKVGGALLGLLQLEAGVENADLTPFGVGELNAAVSIWDLKMDGSGLTGAHLRHKVSARKIAAAPWLEVSTQGRSLLAKPLVETTDTEVKAGPLLIKVTGRFDQTNQNWKGTATLTDGDLSSVAEVIRKSGMASDLKDLGGKISLRAQAAGGGPNPAPTIKGELDLKKVTADYQLASKKIVKLTDLTGQFHFTGDDVGCKKLHVAFPKTDLFFDLDVKTFKTPKINFQLSGSRMAMSDFSDNSENQKGATGVAVIPVSSSKPTAPAEDFRNNPYLKTTKLNGDINLKEVELGWTKADSLTAKLSYDNLVFRLAPVVMKTLGGTITSSTDWDGRPKTPVTKFTLKTDGVDANRFIAAWSDGAKDILSGRLNSDLSLQFAGMTAAEVKKSTAGKGSYVLKDGEFKTVKFSKKPLEALKQIPQFSSSITKTDWQEKFNDASGSFTIHDGRVNFSDLKIQSNLFDASMRETFVDFDQKIHAKVDWLPKEALIPANSIEALKDDKGHPNVPLAIDGPLASPSVTLDQGGVEARLKAYYQKKVDAETKKAIDQAKGKVEEELKKQLKGGNLGNIFK